MKGNGFFATFFCTLLIFLLCVEGCGPGKESREEGGSKQTVQVGEECRSVAYAPFYAAMAKGYFEEEQLSLRLDTVEGRDGIKKGMQEGTYDIGLMGCDGCVEAFQEFGEKYPVVFALLTSRAEAVLLSREETTEFSWDMLKNATVLVENIGMNEWSLRYILEKMNMSDGSPDIRLQKNAESLLEAFQRGEGDYAVASSVLAGELVLSGQAYQVKALGEESGTVPGSSFCVERNIMEAHKEIPEGFSRALQRGMDYVSEHSAEEIGETIAPYFPKTQKKELADMVRKYKEMDLWKKDLVFEKHEYGMLRNILMDFGKMDAPVPYESLCDTELVRKVIEKQEEEP